MSEGGLVASGFTLSLKRPWRTARGDLTARRGFLVRVSDPEGRTGLGEAAPLAPWTEGLKECGQALEAAARVLDGPVENPEEALRDLDAFCRPLAPARAARAACAQALLDLAAQRAGEPLHAYLARTRLQRPAGQGLVPVNATLADGADAAVSSAKAALREGYKAFKLKLAGGPEEDAMVVKSVREAIGPQAELRLDPNGTWTLREAEQRLRVLRAFSPAYVEQPLTPGDLAGMRTLRGLGLVPIAADEAAATPGAALRVLEERAADILVVRPGALGGPDRAADLLRAAQAHGVRPVVTTLLEGPVGTAGALHVAMLLPEPRPACGLATARLFEGAPGPAPVAGHLRPPEGPGLGLGAGRGSA